MTRPDAPAIPYIHDVRGCLGAGGVDRPRLDALAAAGARVRAELAAAPRTAGGPGAPAFLALPDRRDDLAPAVALADRYRARFDDVLLLGTGGSALGARAVAALAPAVAPGAPRLHILDNVDPETLAARLDSRDPARLGVLAVSKSGGTAETLAQLALVLDWLRQARGEAALADQVAVMTEPGPASPLARLAARFDLPRLDHDPGLGGRFSVLATGTVPARLLGLDPAALRAGAATVNAATRAVADPMGAAPVAGAAVQVGLARHAGVTQSVLMPYCDRLAPFAAWFRQLWAESLGKEGRGTTPIDALGPVDQHSQLQLYLDGPADKLITLLTVGAAADGPAIPADLAEAAALPYLRGRTLADLRAAQAEATAETLAEAGRPVRRIHVPRLDAHALGALFQHFMLETVIAAALLGVDPYDQPAVEAGKAKTRARLAAEGAA